MNPDLSRDTVCATIAPGIRKPLCLLGTIAATALIATEFPAYGGLVYPQVPCNLGLVVSCFAQNVNLVSLFQGKLLWFSHSNAPFDLVVKRELRRLSQLALLIYIKSCVSNLKARSKDIDEFIEIWAKAREHEKRLRSIQLSAEELPTKSELIENWWDMKPNLVPVEAYQRSQLPKSHDVVFEHTKTCQEWLESWNREVDPNVRTVFSFS